MKGRGRAGRGWDLGASLDDDPLFFLARSSFRHFLEFRAVSCSCSELLSNRATISLGEQTVEDLLSTPFESTISTSSPRTSPLSSRRNWSISVLRDRCEEAVSSLRAATSREDRWKGSSTSERSSRARNPSTETSIQASRGSPTLIAWPTSWKLSNKGLKSRMR